MAVDGLAIDALDRRVLSPCNGKVTQIHRKTRCSSVRQKNGSGLAKGAGGRGKPPPQFFSSCRHINEIHLLFSQVAVARRQ